MNIKCFFGFHEWCDFEDHIQYPENVGVVVGTMKWMSVDGFRVAYPRDRENMLVVFGQKCERCGKRRPENDEERPYVRPLMPFYLDRPHHHFIRKEDVGPDDPVIWMRP